MTQLFAGSIEHALQLLLERLDVEPAVERYDMGNKVRWRSAPRPC